MHGAMAAKLEDVGGLVLAEPVTWYALLVESNSERRCCTWLRRRQFKPYWPRYQGWVKLNRHRRALRWRSVIPGYLFLPLSVFAAPNWRLIQEAPGVHGVMCSGDGNFVEIPQDGKQGIERIREIEEALNESAVAAEYGIPYKIGQLVMVRRLEITANIVGIASRRQITLEGPMFGSRVRFCVTVDELDAI